MSRSLLFFFLSILWHNTVYSLLETKTHGWPISAAFDMERKKIFLTIPSDIYYLLIKILTQGFVSYFNLKRIVIKSWNALPREVFELCYIISTAVLSNQLHSLYFRQSFGPPTFSKCLFYSENSWQHQMKPFIGYIFSHSYACHPQWSCWWITKLIDIIFSLWWLFIFLSSWCIFIITKNRTNMTDICWIWCERIKM